MNVLRMVFLCVVLIGIAVATPINVALSGNGGLASQSSTYSYMDGATLLTFPASLANDDILNNQTGTNFDANAWWQVVFNDTYTISTINVYNRTDGNGANSNPFSLYLYDSIGAVAWSSAGLSIDGTNFGTFTVPDINAMTMKFQLDGINYLGLAEIQVIGDVLASGGGGTGGGGDPGGDPGAETPELATYTLIASGLAMMAWRRRREA